MPNHVKNRLRVYKDSQTALRIKSVVESIVNDPLHPSELFDSFFPMPEDIRNASGDEWYYWSCDNWGTKWDAYRVEIVGETEDYFDFNFCTAWCIPEGFYEKLADLDGKLTIYGDYADEDIGVNCGEFDIELGNFHRDRKNDSSEDAIRFAMEIWEYSEEEIEEALREEREIGGEE